MFCLLVPCEGGLFCHSCFNLCCVFRKPINLYTFKILMRTFTCPSTFLYGILTYPLQSEVLPASLAGRLQDLEDVCVPRPPLHRVEHHPDLGCLFPSQCFTFLLLFNFYLLNFNIFILLFYNFFTLTFTIMNDPRHQPGILGFH